MKCPRCKHSIQLLYDYAIEEGIPRETWYCSKCSSWITEFWKEGIQYTVWEDLRGKSGLATRN